MGASDDKRKERKLVQRFLHANSMLSDKIYVTIETTGNLLITRLNTLLATTGTNEQQFGDIKKRTYLSDQAETSAFYLVSNATVLDFLRQSQQVEWPVFEMIEEEMERRKNTKTDEYDLKACPNCGRFHTGNCIKNSNGPTRIETHVFDRIIRNISISVEVINSVKRFDEQWDLIYEINALGFKCGETIRQIIQLNKRNKSNNPDANNPSMDWEIYGNF